MPHLASYDFGHITAENDEKRLRDPSCFCETPSWNSANLAHKFLIVGRKGSGKTSIRIGMDAYQKQINQMTCHIDFADFSSETLLNLIDPIEHELFSKSSFLKNTWRFAIALKLARGILSSSFPKSTKEKIYSLQTIIENPSGLPDCRDEDGDYNLHNIFSTAVLGLVDLINSNPKPNQILNYPITKRFKSAEHELYALFAAGETGALLTIDDFDDAFEEYHEVAQPMIIGMTDAVKSVFSEYETSTNKKQLKIKAFVPEDAFGPRDYRHYDKVSPVPIQWNPKDLGLFVARRIHPTLRLTGHVGGNVPRGAPTSQDEVTKTLNKLFDPIAEGDPYRDPITWLAHFCLERPRDIILLLDGLRSKILESKEDATSISSQNLYSYLPPASEVIAENIIREYSSKFPKLSSAIAAFASGRAELSPEKIQSTLQQTTDLISDHQTVAYWMNALYECGFLCKIYLRKSGMSYKKVAVTSWRDDAAGDVDADSFIIHQVFWRYSRLSSSDWIFEYA